MLRDVLAVSALAAAINVLRYCFAVFVDSSLGQRIASRRKIRASQDSKIISAARNKALLRFIPWTIPVSVMIYIALLADNSSGLCTRIFGMNLSFVALTMFTYALPAMFALITLFAVPVALKTIRTGYFPPLDSTFLIDTIATRGVASRFRGWVLLVLPVFSLYLVYLGHTTFRTILGGQTVAELLTVIGRDCPAL